MAQPANNCWGETYTGFTARIKNTPYFHLFRDVRERIRETLAPNDTRKAWSEAAAYFPPGNQPLLEAYEIAGRKPPADGSFPAELGGASGPARTMEGFTIPHAVLNRLPRGSETTTKDEIVWAFEVATLVRMHAKGPKSVDWKRAPSLKAVEIARFAYLQPIDFHKIYGRMLLPEESDVEAEVRRDLVDNDEVCDRLEAEFLKNQREWRLTEPVPLPE
jgi:hypothetical protein